MRTLSTYCGAVAMAVGLGIVFGDGCVVAFGQEQFLDDPSMGEEMPLDVADGMIPTEEGIAVYGNEVDVWKQAPDGDQYAYAADLDNALIWWTSLDIEVRNFEADAQASRDPWDLLYAEYLRAEMSDALDDLNEYDHHIYGFGHAKDDNDRAGRRVDLAYYYLSESAWEACRQKINEAWEYIELRVADETLGRSYYWEADSSLYDISMEVYGY